MNKNEIASKVDKINPVKKVKSKKLRIVIYVVILLVILKLVSGFFKPKSNEDKYEEYTVERGSINVTIEGNGTVKPNDQYDITALVQGEILNDYFEEGQVVEKDQLLYEIESEDLKSTIDRAKLAIERAQSAYDTTLQMSRIKASTNGVLTNFNLKLGDVVMQGQQIAEVIDNANLRIVLPFNSIDTQNMYVGQLANVVVENGYYPLTGSITKISSNKVLTNSGIGIAYVEIAVKNPGNIQSTDYGIATINGITSNSSSTFEFVNKSIIYATGSGYVKEVKCLAGDNVSNGTVIAVLGGDALDAQIEQAQLTLNDARLAYDNAQYQLKNYNIKAPISGKILVKNKKKGDVLSATSSMTGANTLAIIADMDKIVFNMNVDELDIAKVQVGQKVKITADANEDVEYIGTVDNINVVGTSVNGVATYTVKIVIDNPEGLFPGMNVDSAIQIVSIDDAIRVPLAAVKRGNIVYIKDKPTYQDEDKEVPKGYRKVEVEIGKSDKSYIEILSGLKEGDIILVEKAGGNSIFDFMSSMSEKSSQMMGSMQQL